MTGLLKTTPLAFFFVLVFTQSGVFGEIPDSADDICPLLIGARVPNLTLRTPEGDSFDLKAAIAKKPTVLIFYRGSWCPYCNMHLAALAEAEPELLRIGYQIIAISPDQEKFLNSSIAKHDLKYQLLSDSQVEAAKAFGLAFRVDDTIYKNYESYGIDLEGASGQKHHILPVPAVFLVNTEGIILFQYVNPNYKVRLQKEVLVAAARAFAPKRK